MSDPTLQELDALEATLSRQLEDLKKTDPYYWYEPSTGSIPAEAMVFLKEYLREEDIPAKTESQLDAHLCTAQTILAAGGNQAGKSTWLVIEALIHATGEIPDALKNVYPVDKLPEEKYRILRLEGESETQVDAVLIPTVRFWVPKSYLKNNSWEESYSAKSRQLILHKDGIDVAKIYFNNFTQDVSKLQGVKLTFVGYDEEPPRAHRDENLMRMTTAKRLCERFAMTPTKGVSWVLNDIVKKQDAHTRAFKIASVTNSRANLDVLRQIMAKIPGYEARKMRLLGEFISLTGLIYGGLFNRDVHLIKPFDVGCTCTKIEEDGTHHHKCPYRAYMVVRGADIHTVKSPAVIEAAIDHDENIYLVGCYNPKECPDIEEIKQDLADRVTQRKWRVRWTAVDRSLNVDIKAAGSLNLYKKFIRGANKVRPCHLSEKYAGSILAGVDEIKQLMKPNEATKRPRFFIFDTPEMAPLINDIETLERDAYNDPDKKGEKDKIREGAKDRHAAARYIFQRRLRWSPMDEPTYTQANEEDEAFI